MRCNIQTLFSYHQLYESIHVQCYRIFSVFRDEWNGMEVSKLLRRTTHPSSTTTPSSPLQNFAEVPSISWNCDDEEVNHIFGKVFNRKFFNLITTLLYETSDPKVINM
jgi:hypothetical protein